MAAGLRQSIADRIFRVAAPEAAPVTLVQRRIFILPTREGYFFAGVLAVLLAACIQYQLSLGFLLTFLLAGMAGIGMLHTWRNLAHLKVRPGRCDPVFAGDTAHYSITLESPARTRVAIAVKRREGDAVHADVPPGAITVLDLPVVMARRGLAHAGRIEVFTRYPVGLFHAWSYVDFDLAVLVYPRPDTTAGAPPMESRGDAEEGIPVPGDEEFNVLRPYRAGDPPKLVAWKALARGQGLLTKEFSAMASSELWIDWEAARAPDPEHRLSILCHWVLQAERYGQGYGLRLPGVAIAPARGEAHRARCLEALARYEVPR